MAPSRKHYLQLRVLLVALFGLIPLLAPLFYFLVAFQYESGRLQAHAENIGIQVTEMINANPEYWQFQVDAINRALLIQHNAFQAENIQLVTLSDSLVAEITKPLKPPTLLKSAYVMDSGEVIGRVDVRHSLFDACIEAGGIFILTSLMSLAVFYLANHFVLKKLLAAEIMGEDLQNKMNLSSKLAAIGTLTAGVAHEINNPLAIIIGQSAIIRKFANDSEKVVSKIASIEKAAERISKIVGGLKKLSRTSNDINYAEHNLSDVIQEALTLIEINPRKRETLITCDFKAQPSIACDEIEIEQVLINLINNAMDAIKDEPEKWVRIELLEKDPFVVLRIIDSGTGIPDAVASKLFDSFFTTKVIGEGTGLGLSIVKGILDKHQATISIVKNSPNTCFEICFPMIAKT